MFDFGYGYFRGSGHHRVEIARGLAINEIAPPIAFPCFDEGEVSLQRVFHHIQPAIKLTGLFVLAYEGAYPGRRKKCRDTRTSGANALGKRSLWHKLKVNLVLDDHRFQQFVLADVGANVTSDLASGK